jgi:hypothetical protein
MMEAIYSSKSSIFIRATRRHISYDENHHSYWELVSTETQLLEHWDSSGNQRKVNVWHWKLMPED